MAKRSDEQLIANYLNGDEKSLALLIKRYLRPVYGFLYRYAGNPADTEDITQEAFIKAWRNIKKFAPEKSFKTWIFTIAKNTALDWLKKKKPAPFSFFSARGGSAFGGECEEGDNFFIDSLRSVSVPADKLFEQKESAEKINSALDRMPPEHRETLGLYFKEQLNLREIAERLGEPLNTVKSRYRRALLLLKKLLMETGI